jgi:hypothetical protein
MPRLGRSREFAGGAVEKNAAVVNAKLAGPLRHRLDAGANIPERPRKISA